MDTHYPRLISPGQRHRPLPLLLELIKTEGSAARPDLHGTAQQPINRLLPEEDVICRSFSHSVPEITTGIVPLMKLANVASA